MIFDAGDRFFLLIVVHWLKRMEMLKLPTDSDETIFLGEEIDLKVTSSKEDDEDEDDDNHGNKRHWQRGADWR